MVGRKSEVRICVCVSVFLDDNCFGQSHPQIEFQMDLPNARRKWDLSLILENFDSNVKKFDSKFYKCTATLLLALHPNCLYILRVLSIVINCLIFAVFFFFFVLLLGFSFQNIISMCLRSRPYTCMHCTHTHQQ